MSEWNELLFLRARQVGEALQSAGERLVLAESCTGGLVSMAMTSVSGISEFFCGSAVTYRNDTKARWLGVSADDLANPAIGAVSSQVAEQMCQGVLDRTPEASLAAAITGHLGPNAPEGLDGVVYIGLVFRSAAPVTVQRHLLSAQTEVAERQRPVRQQEAAVLVLQSILAELKRQTH